MKKLYPVFWGMLFLLLSNCHITQEYHFNKDLSGSYRFEIQMEELINMIKMTDTTGKTEESLERLDTSLAEVARKYEEMGLKNVEIGQKDNNTSIYVRFDFANIESLNSIFEQMNQGKNLLSDYQGPAIHHKGTRNISFDYPKEIQSQDSSGKLDAMKGFITFENKFSFDRKIKKLDNPNAILSDDKKSFIIKGKVEDVLDKKIMLDTKIKLRRK